MVAVELMSACAEGLGARAIEQRHGHEGALQAWELEITEYEPDRLLRIVGQCEGVRFDELHSFLPTGAPTTHSPPS